MTLRKISLLFFGFSIFAMARPTSASQLVEPPLSSYSVGNLVDDFRNQLKIKLEDLSKNYYGRMSGSEVTYFNSESTKCGRGGRAAQRQVAAAINVQTTGDAQNLQQVVSYFGCKRRILFQELFRSKGSDLKSPSNRELWFGKYSADLLPNETEKFYQVSYKGQAIFTFMSQRTDSGIKTNLLIGTDGALTRMESRNENKAEVLYEARAFQFLFVEDESTHRGKVDIPRTSFKIVSKANGESLFYYNQSQEPLPLAKYSKLFSDYVLNASIIFCREVIKELISEMPETSLVSTGVQAKKLQEELRLYLNYFRQEINPKAIERFFNMLLEAVSNNLIIDNRPQE